MFGPPPEDKPLPYGEGNRIDPLGPPTRPESDLTGEKTKEYRLPAGLLGGAPGWVSALLGALAVAGTVLGGLIPPPIGGLVAIVGYVLGAVAGMTQAPPQWVVGRPVVQGAAVAVAGTVAAAAGEVAPGLPEGWPRVAATGVALLTAWLAGRAAPALPAAR